MENHLRPVAVIRFLCNAVNLLSQRSLDRRGYHVHTGRHAQHLGKAVAAAARGDFHDVWFAVFPDSGLYIVNGCTHPEKRDEPLDFRCQFRFLLLCKSRRPAVSRRCIRIVGILIEPLRRERHEFQFPVHGEAVGVRRAALLLNELLDDYLAGERVGLRIVKCWPQVIRKIHSRHALAAGGIRIEAPIPGKAAVGIEIPNKTRTTVTLRSILEAPSFAKSKAPLTFAVGKDIAGNCQVGNLAKMPHLLIAGTTGSGKSVCTNSIIMSMLYRCSPQVLRMILIDPKMVEFAQYNGIPHLLMPVVTEPRKAAGALGAAVAEMEKRYHLLAENGVPNIEEYNALAKENATLEPLPYIVIVIDELADLMMVAGKEVEDYICRIAQKARAAGMHLIIATQRPSVDVITGLIKANIPSRIGLTVMSQIDSRTILDTGGAEKLLGNGDMLYMPVGVNKPVRIQGTFVRSSEIRDVIEFIKKHANTNYNEEMIAEMDKCAVKESVSSGSSDEDDDEDPMYESAVEAVIDAGQASVSLVQRRCKLGYARAARLIDEMERDMIVGPYEGAKPRKVLITRQDWIEMRMNREAQET